MRKPADSPSQPRWEWRRQGGGRLFAADGSEFYLVDELLRVEVERLLGLGDLEAVQIQCGGGVERWVGPTAANALWREVEHDLDDVEGWQPPPEAPGALQYRAELWRTDGGRYALIFTNE